MTDEEERRDFLKWWESLDTDGKLFVTGGLFQDKDILDVHKLVAERAREIRKQILEQAREAEYQELLKDLYFFWSLRQRFAQGIKDAGGGKIGILLYWTRSLLQDNPGLHLTAFFLALLDVAADLANIVLDKNPLLLSILAPNKNDALELLLWRIRPKWLLLQQSVELQNWVGHRAKEEMTAEMEGLLEGYDYLRRKDVEVLIQEYDPEHLRASLETSIRRNLIDFKKQERRWNKRHAQLPEEEIDLSFAAADFVSAIEQKLEMENNLRELRPKLSPRQADVLRLTLEGKNDPEIARHLSLKYGKQVTEGNIRYMKTQIRKKLGDTALR